MRFLKCVCALGIVLSLAVAGVVVASRSAYASAMPGAATGPGVGGQLHAFAFDPDDEQTAYAGGDVCGVYKLTYSNSNCRISGWEPWSAGLGFNDLNMAFYVDDILVLGEQSGVDADFQGVYAATWGGIYFRKRDSAEWTCRTENDTYTGGYANRVFDLSGSHPASLRIPFSSLAFDRRTKTLYAGAGHGRTDDDVVAWNVRKYKDFYPTTTGETRGHLGEHSIWACNLQLNQEFEYVPDTDNGKVRQIAVSEYVEADGDTISEVVYACDAGIMTLGPHVGPLWTLTSTNKSGFDASKHSSDPWGVGAGGNGVIYGLMSRQGTSTPGDTLSAGLWTASLVDESLIWTPVKGDGSVVPYPHSSTTWDDILSDATACDLTDLTVVRNVAGAFDEIFVGEGRNGHRYGQAGVYRFGPYPDAGTLKTGWMHIHRTVVEGTGPERIHFLQWTGTSVVDHAALDEDIGWYTFFPLLRSLVPFAVHPTNIQIMVSVDYGIPLITVDSGAEWSNLYCSGNSSEGWTNRGLNLMDATSSAVTSQGRLVMGALDYGGFVSTNAANTAYRPLHDPDHLEPPYWVKGDDVETVRRGTADEIYLVDGAANGRIWIWDSAASILRDISADLADTLRIRASAGADTTTYITDLAFADSTRAYVSAAANVPVATSDTTVIYERHYFVCKGTRSESGAWSWSVCHDAHARYGGTKVINRLSIVPGTDKVIYGAMAKWCYGGVLSPGGLYCVDPVSGAVEQWLQPGGDVALERLARNVTAVAVDKSGQYAYAGSSGYATPWSSGRGGVVRMRIVNGEPGLPEVLAGDGDTFGVGILNNYPAGAPVEGWEYGTKITDIEIDPHNPKVFYVALNNGSYFHGRYGAWCYRNGQWDPNPFVGTETGSGAATVAVLPGAAGSASELYIGTTAHEFFTAPITLAQPVYTTIADAAEFPLLAGATDTTLVFAVRIAATGGIQEATVDLTGLGLVDSVLTLRDDGLDQDIASGDEIFTSHRFAKTLAASSGLTVQVFAEAKLGGYVQEDVVVEVVASRAKFVDVSAETGALATLLPASEVNLPYSATYFSATTDTLSEKVMIVTFDDNTTTPLVLERWRVVGGAPEFLPRLGAGFGSWVDSLAAGSRGVDYADFDNDRVVAGLSDYDFFICNPTAGGRLYRSDFAQGSPKFRDVTDSLFVAEAVELSGAVTASWGHFDGGNFVDLAVATSDYTASVKDLDGNPPFSSDVKIFKNVGGNSFEMAPYTGSSGGPNICLSLAWADLDQDGDQDLVTWHYLNGNTGGGGAPFLMLNLGYSEVQGEYVMVPSGLNIFDTWTGGMSVSVVDYDHDWDALRKASYPDLLVTESFGFKRAMILKNLMGEGSETLAFETIVLEGYRDWAGATVANFDNNMQDDILLLPETGEPSLYMGDWDNAPIYSELAFALGLRPGATSGALTADFNGDRISDLFMGRIKTDQFMYVNTGPTAGAGGGTGPAKWLKVILGTIGNSDRAMIGATVTVTVDGVNQTRTVSGGSDRGGQASNEMVFGLGDFAGDSAAVTIKFMSGEVYQFLAGTNAIVNVIEDQPVVLKSGTRNDPEPDFAYNLEPGFATWVFRWCTKDISGDLSQDVVHLENYANYESGDDCYLGIEPGEIKDLRYGDPNVEHSVWRIGVYWQHEIRWTGIPCQTGCQYRFTASSGLGDGTIATTGVTVTAPISYCIPGNYGQ